MCNAQHVSINFLYAILAFWYSEWTFALIARICDTTISLSTHADTEIFLTSFSRSTTSLCLLLASSSSPRR